MKILLFEDELRNADRLVRLLLQIDPTCDIDGPIATICEAAHWLRTRPAPDLILSDIRLSDGLSFDALKEAPASVPIIFTTAYEEYAIRAFKYNSFDYLLKPVDKEELAEAIDKVKRLVPVADSSDLRQLIESMARNNYKYRERFLIPCHDGYKTVPVGEINYIFTENKIVRLFLRNGSSETISTSMEELEAQLDPARFFRANRQYIVRMESIRYLGNYFGGKLVLHLNGYPDTEIVVSKEKAQRLKEWLDK